MVPMSNGELDSLVTQSEGKDMPARTAEGRRRAISNLRRRVKRVPASVKPIEPLPSLPPPTVPMKFPNPKTLETARGRATAAVMTQEEHDIYVECYNEWMASHATEYNLPEDIEDVHRICMERVIQFRLEMYQANHPHVDTSKAYDQSVRRQEQARKNLLARRADREGAGEDGDGRGGKRNVTNVNIVQIAGGIDPQKAFQAMEDRRKQLDSEEDLFLGATADNTEGVEEIIDVEAEPARGE